MIPAYTPVMARFRTIKPHLSASRIYGVGEEGEADVNRVRYLFDRGFVSQIDGPVETMPVVDADDLDGPMVLVESVVDGSIGRWNASVGERREFPERIAALMVRESKAKLLGKLSARGSAFLSALQLTRNSTY
jgi:hypothetical protein